MPELPDIVVYIEALGRRVLGETVRGIRIAAPSVLRTYDPPYDTVVGKDVVSLQRVGKRVVFGLEEDIFLVDVREQNEYEIVSIPGATLIPKGEFLMGNALEKMPQDKKIVLHCKTGVRSAEALAALHKAGFADAVHVGGGVVAWAKQVDTSLPTY